MTAPPANSTGTGRRIAARHRGKRRHIAFGWYGGKYTHLNFLVPLFPVLCYCHHEPERICLVVEVKDMELTLSHVQASSLKAKRSDAGLTSLLFTVPGVHTADAEGIQALARREWASGLNIYTTSIVDLAKATLALVGEIWRLKLLRAIGDELDERQDQVARRAWHDLLLVEAN